MIFIKNKLYILLLLITYILPLGGIGVSWLNNIISSEGYEQDNNFSLSFEDSGLEQGPNIFIYFDALPNNLAIEYSKEIKWQELNSTIIFNDESITNPLFTVRTSDYLTIRKDIVDLSIPILAKVALSIGGGFNTHKSVAPSINLLKDIYDVEELGDLYNQASEKWDQNAIIGKLEDNAIKSSGLHIQCGLQAKILMLNAFVNTKYTFIIKDDNNSIESFPGITIGLAFGI
jgi:hypothetical protein